MQPVFSVALRPSTMSAGSGVYKNIPGPYISNYSHTITAFGGYDTAQIQVRIKRVELEEYLTRIIGSNIKVQSGESDQIWEGFINEISLTYIDSGADITVGPIMDIANKVLVRYSDYVTGVPGVTTYANDILSQTRYGIFTKVLNSASVSATNAANIRDHYIRDNKFPAYNITLSNQSDVLSVTLNCLGYIHLLSTYVYNNSNVGTYTVREKIIETLQAHPGSLFNRSGLIGTNALSVDRVEDEDRLAIDVIKELVALGSATNNDRMLFGIYDDRVAIYKVVPTNVTRFYKNYKNNRFIFNNSGGKVNMATLKPGQYIGISDIPDFISGGIRSVAKYIFAESITYTAPFDLSITGTYVSTLQQKLAKLGISGLS